MKKIIVDKSLSLTELGCGAWELTFEDLKGRPKKRKLPPWEVEKEPPVEIEKPDNQRCETFEEALDFIFGTEIYITSLPDGYIEIIKQSGRVDLLNNLALERAIRFIDQLNSQTVKSIVVNGEPVYQQKTSVDDFPKGKVDNLIV